LTPTREERDQEREQVQALDQLATGNGLQNIPLFLIEANWLADWRSYVTGETARPGAIPNHLLLQPDGTPREDLRPVRDFRGVAEPVWDALMHIYGGGPVIARWPPISIYSRPFYAEPPKITTTTSSPAITSDSSSSL